MAALQRLRLVAAESKKSFFRKQNKNFYMILKYKNLVSITSL